MSLHVYRRVEDLPKGMKYVRMNDSYFNMECSLNRSDIVQNKILNDIEQASIESEDSFIGRNGIRNISSRNLSTGVKTLLNIHSHPEVCFDVVECGNNVLEYLKHFSNGNILWKYPNVLFSSKDYSCDIVYKEKSFDDFLNFLKYIRNEGNL